MFVLLLLIGDINGLSVLFQQPDLYSTSVVRHTVTSLGGNILDAANVSKSFTELPEETFVLVSPGRKVLFNSLTGLETKFGDIVVSGSASCLTSCDEYKGILGKYPYLDSSVIIGRGSDLAGLNLVNLQDSLTERYLASDKNIVLDRNGNIVGPINGKNQEKVVMQFEEGNNTLVMDKTKPHIILLSSPAAAPIFSEVSRYVGNVVTRSTCALCERVTTRTKPSLFIVVHAIEKVSFLANLLESLELMEYDRSVVELIFYSAYEEPLMKEFYNPYFKRISYTDKELDDNDHDVRHSFLSLFAESAADMYLYLDTSVYITRDTITKLVDLQKPLVSPMLKKNDGTAWSNFWGGYDLLSWSYTRSGDYDNIFSQSVQGVFPVSCTRNMYLVARSVALSMLNWEVYDRAHFDPEISLCKALHEHAVPMFLSNEVSWGWLKEPSTLNDLLFYRNATLDWETKYILKVPKAEDFVKTSCNAHIHKASGVLKENFGKDLVEALSSNIGGYQDKPEKYHRPGYDIEQSAYNKTLVDVIMRLTTHVISDLYPQYTPKNKLYDLRIHEVEGSGPSRQLTGNPAAYQMIMPLNNPFEADEKERFSFYRQNCTVDELEVGDILLLPGSVTHTAKPIHPRSGMFLYLSASFDSDEH